MRHRVWSRSVAVIVFVTAFVTLTLEVFYTRLFSALFWKDTASAILSLAMLGLGASGVLVYLKPNWFKPERTASQITWWTLAFGVSVVGSYVSVLLFSKTTVNMMAPVWGFGPLIVAGLIPFFVGGTVLSIVFTHHSSQISKLYLYDLVGASLGAVFVLPVLTWVNGPGIVPILALPAVVAATWFAKKNGQKAATGVGAVLSLGVVGLFGAHQAWNVLGVTHSDGKEEVVVTMERWDPIARVTVLQPHPNNVWFHIDSRVATAVLPYSGDATQLEFLHKNVLQLAYHHRQYPKVLIIGPGGGSDVLSAIVFGNRDITAVEINRSMIGLIRGELKEFTGGLYDLPFVDVKVADGRAYVAGMDGKVDLIQATFIDTVAAANAGAHTLSENYLYTTDSMHDMFDHLTEDGVLSLSRWGGVAWGFTETHRVLSLMTRAMQERGIESPGRHIIAVRGPPPERLTLGFGYQNKKGDMESMTTVLAKASEFTDEEVARLTKVVEDNSFLPVWMAGRGKKEDVTIGRLFESGVSAGFLQRYHEATGMDISPVDDDRPFFFDMIDPIDELLHEPKPEWKAIPYRWVISIGLGVLYQLLAATSILVLLLIILPLLFRYRALRGVKRPVSTLGYFVCLGLGFIGIEIAMIQRLALFLEHPVYSLVVVLASILLFSGLGSASTAKIDKHWAMSAAKRAGVLVLILAVYGMILRVLPGPLMGLPFALKVLVAVVLLFPPAYVMGMMFPLGVGAIRGEYERLVPWVWGLNSSFSVFGAIASLFVAMTLGHTIAWYIFASMYALAGLAMLRVARA